ncbi:hypothetical protein [Pleomorphochaeta sp. DL1XJH-081]|uniref:hypothetical protein n=1 Tax=Pleomorphochaeta sp. DL1XJH-081 TaxID=3409690 RepID=UPI003BB555D2
MKKILTVFTLIVAFSFVWAADKNILDSRYYLFYDYQLTVRDKPVDYPYHTKKVFNLDFDTNVFIHYFPSYEAHPIQCTLTFMYTYSSEGNNKYFDSTLTIKNEEMEIQLTDENPHILFSPSKNGMLNFTFHLDEIPEATLRSIIENDSFEVYIDYTKLDMSDAIILQIKNFLRDFLLPELTYEDFVYLDRVRGVNVIKSKID